MRTTHSARFSTLLSCVCVCVCCVVCAHTLQGQQPQGLFEREVQAYQDLSAQGGVSGGAGGVGGGGGGGNKKEKLRTFLSQKSEEAKAKLADLREEGEKRLEKMREEKRGGARYDRYDHHDQAPSTQPPPSSSSSGNIPFIAPSARNSSHVLSGSLSCVCRHSRSDRCALVRLPHQRPAPGRRRRRHTRPGPRRRAH